MKHTLRYLISFVTANVLVLLPVVWMMTGIVHDRLDYEVLTRRPLSLFEMTDGQLGRSIAVDGSERVQITKTYLSSETDWNTMGFGFGNGPTEFDLASISVRSHLMVKWTLDLDSLIKDFEKTGGLESVTRTEKGVHVVLKGNDGGLVPKPGTQARWRLGFAPDRRVAALLVGLEFGLLLFCFVPFFLKPIKETRLMQFRSAACVALLVAAFYSLVVPLQSYLGNLDACKYTLGELLPELLLNTLSAFVAVSAALLVLERFFGKLFHLLAFGVVLYGYLEIGILSIGAPVLNGDVVYYSNLNKGLFDAGVAALAIGLPILFYRWTKLYVQWAALALLVLTGASIFDAHSEPEPKPEGCIVNEFVSKPEVLASAFYSSHTNVLLFCLDSVTTEISTKLMRESPELREKFPGFIAYDNNIGMHGFTALGVPGFMTGEYFNDPTAMGAYTFSIYREKSFLAPYIQRDYPVFCNAGAYDSIGVTNRRKKSVKNDGREERTCLLRRPGTQLDWNLNEIVQFRLTPFILKQWVSSMIVVGWDSSKNCSTEEECFSILANAPIVDSEPKTMHYYHTFGCHQPFQIDRNGMSCGMPRRDFLGASDKTYYVLKQLGTLFDAYRQRGVYDNSFIIVCSDHGDHFTERKIADPKKVMPGHALAMLWVKPIGEKGAFEVSSLPTSSSKIAELVKRSCSEMIDRSLLVQIVKQESRLFRGVEKDLFCDWIVDKDGIVEYKETKPVVDVAELKTFSLGCRCPLGYRTSKSDIPIAYEGISSATASAPRIGNDTEEFSISFRVNNTDGRYEVVLEFQVDPDAAAVYGHRPTYKSGAYFQLSNVGGVAIGPQLDFTHGHHADVKLPGLKPNRQGVIRILGKRHGFDGSAFLTAITVKEEK